MMSKAMQPPNYGSEILKLSSSLDVEVVSADCGVGSIFIFSCFFGIYFE